MATRAREPYEVYGVHIDLRHEELSLVSWRLMGRGLFTRNGRGLAFNFPGQSTWHLGDERTMSEQDHAAVGAVEDLEEHYKDELGYLPPGRRVDLEPGDRLIIGTVREEVFSKDETIPLDDRLWRIARLDIVRNEKAMPTAAELIFCPLTALATASEDTGAHGFLQVLTARALARLGLKELSQFDFDNEPESYDGWLAAIANMVSITAEELQGIPGSRLEDFEYRSGLVRNLVTRAVAFGYHSARVELHQLGLVTGAVVQAQRSSAGGKGRARKLLEERERWAAVARPLIRAFAPRFKSVSKLQGEVWVRWTGPEDVLHPEPATLGTLIREMIAEESLVLGQPG